MKEFTFKNTRTTFLGKCTEAIDFISDLIKDEVNEEEKVLYNGRVTTLKKELNNAKAAQTFALTMNLEE